MAPSSFRISRENSALRSTPSWRECHQRRAGSPPDRPPSGLRPLQPAWLGLSEGLVTRVPSRALLPGQPSDPSHTPTSWQPVLGRMVRPCSHLDCSKLQLPHQESLHFGFRHRLLSVRQLRGMLVGARWPASRSRSPRTSPGLSPIRFMAPGRKPDCSISPTKASKKGFIRPAISRFPLWDFLNASIVQDQRHVSQRMRSSSSYTLSL